MTPSPVDGKSGSSRLMTARNLSRLFKQPNSYNYELEGVFKRIQINFSRIAIIPNILFSLLIKGMFYLLRF